MNLDEFRQLSAGNALRALSTEEERTFSAALNAHPEWQSIVDADLETTAGLGASVTKIPPPPSIRARLLEAVSADAADDSGASEQTGGTDSVAPDAASIAPDAGTSNRTRSTMWRVGAFALAASVALLAALTLGPGLIESLQPDDPAVVALQTIEDAPDAAEITAEVAGGGSATLHWSAAESRAVLVADRLPTLNADQDFEMWLVRGEEPISVGLLQTDAEQPALFVAETFEPGDVVAITVEEAGGSPTGLPTSDPIAAIATA